MKCPSMIKRLAVAAIAAASLAGPITAAHALQFNTGDAVLVVYGNNTEYAQNLGSFSTLLTNGIDLDLSSILSSVGGANTLKYTIVGNTASTIFFGDTFAASAWTASQKNSVFPNTYNSALANWSGPLGVAGDTRTLFPVNDLLSFSTNLNGSGADTLGGSIPAARRGSADIDTVLNLLQRPISGAGSTLATVGTALLSSSNGHFVISTVPVPAAVVLFATGIVGLVGMARRRVSGLQ